MAVVVPTVGHMRIELPVERLHRRLSSEGGLRDEEGSDSDVESSLKVEPATDTDSAKDPDEDPNSLLPRWVPADSAGQGWVSRLRADPGRSGAIALAAIAALAVLITVFTLVRDRPAPVTSAKLPPVERVSSSNPRSSASAGPSTGADRPVVVSVVGLVPKPGLFTLAPGARIADALQAAGGPMPGADTIGLNMARPVGDGEQIVVGLAPPAGKPTVLGSSVGPGGPAAPAPSATGTTSAKAKTAPPQGKVLDLNTATVEQLDDLPGLGPVTAAAIVAWRQTNGRFTNVDQLADVDGIGPARLDKLRALVRV